MTLYSEPLFLSFPTNQPATIDATEVREHLALLSRHGIGYRRASDLAGVTPGVTRRILFGRDGVLPARVSRVKAEQLLAVHTDATDSALVEATGTRRRVQGLLFMGWSPAKIADRLGVSSKNFSRIVRVSRVRASTAAAVEDLFDQIWNVQPPMITTADKFAATRARRSAREAGWRGPLDWDDIDNDEGPAKTERTPDIDEIAVELACHGTHVKLNYLERKEAVTQLHAQYLSDGEISERLGLNPRVTHRIRRHGLDLPATHDSTRQVILAPTPSLATA